MSIFWQFDPQFPQLYSPHTRSFLAFGSDSASSFHGEPWVVKHQMHGVLRYITASRIIWRIYNVKRCMLMLPAVTTVFCEELCVHRPFEGSNDLVALRGSVWLHYTSFIVERAHFSR